MGSGLSLSNKQVLDIVIRDINKIKRTMTHEFYKLQAERPLYTDDGYEIYYDFSDEERYRRELTILERTLEQIIKNKNKSNKK